MLKLDFDKAYDSVDHDFLLEVMDWVSGRNGKIGLNGVSLLQTCQC